MYQPARFNKLKLFPVAVYQLLHTMSCSLSKATTCSELHKCSLSKATTCSELHKCNAIESID